MDKFLRSRKTQQNNTGLRDLRARIKLIFMILVFIFSLVGMVPSGVLAAGATYYVNNTLTCSDSSINTSVTPFCTIYAGAHLAVAGDTVRVLAGTYAETVNPQNTGSVGLPITFSAATGVTVTGSPGGSAFQITNDSYIVIDGFTITNTMDYGISVVDSNHITISNNHVSYSGSTSDVKQGIYINGTTDSTITGNITDHNTNHGIHLTGGCTYITVRDNISFANAQQIVRNANGIRLDASTNNTILHNITYANEDSGLNFYTGSSNNLILGNLTYGNGDHGIDNNASPNNTVVGNTVHGNVTSGINFEGSSAGSGGATVANNIMVDNGLLRQVGGGTTPTGQPSNLRFDNNSLVGNNLDYNIFYLSSGTYQIKWGGGSYTTLAAFKAAVPGQEANGIQANPLFIAPAPIAEREPTAPYWVAINEGDYHISAGSPAIDSANSDAPGEPSTDIDGHARVDDPATANTGAGTRAYDDRGAYEFQPSGSFAPTVTTQAVTVITTTTATGNGNITFLGSPNPTQHGVVWSTSPNPTTVNSKTTQGAVGATGAFTSNITGLTPGTLYYVRAYATNTVGTSYGSEVTFTALLAPTVTTQAVNVIGEFTATGNGNITGLGVPSPTEHGVVWSTSVNPTIADSKTADGPIIATGAFTSNITGLTPSTLYHVRAYATNAVGTSYGGDVTFTTLQPANAPVVTTQAVSGIGQTSATGNGNITALGVPNPTEHGVVWSTSTNPTIADGKTTDGPVNATGAFTSAITGLTPNTLYYVRAYATNTVSTSYGGEVSFTTLPASTDVFTTSGNWIAPAGVTSITVEVWGGGGKGGSRATGGSGGFGGGGGGAYSIKTLAVTPGNSYPYVVGTGASGTTAGGDSYFINTTTVLAKGGGSVADNSTTGASGGSAVSGYGDTKYSGGNGATGTGTYGGGGGSSAGIAANGADATNATGATAPSGGGNGGSGRSGSSGSGTGGSAPGGAGGGAYRTGTGGTQVGGNGANGQVRITYYVEVKATTTSVNCGAGTPVVSYGSSINCVATVTASSGTTSPSGSVSWLTSGAGSFITSPCTLSGTGGSATCSVSYSPTSVGTGSHLITANFAGTVNFLPSNGNQAVTVNPKVASVTPNAASKIYGAVDPTLTGTLTGFLPADGVSAIYSRIAGENVVGGPYAISAVLSPAGALPNYAITYNTADFNVTKANATITVNGFTGAYDGSPHGATLVSAIGVKSEDLSASVDLGFLFTNVPGGTAQWIFSDIAGNYNNTSGDVAIDITAKPITITPNTSQTKVFGAVDPTLTYTNTELVGSDAISGTLGRVAGENVNTYAFTLGNLAAGTNYTLEMTASPATFSITAKPINITPNTGQTKVFGAVDPTLTYTNTALVGSDAISGTLGRVEGENVNTYAYTLGTLIAGTNYTLEMTASPATFSITAKPITVTPDTGQTKVFGTADPSPFTYTNTALIGSDAISGSLGRVSGEDVGLYDFNLGTLNASPNYSLSLSTTNRFEITKASQIIIFTSIKPSVAVVGGTYTPTASGGASGNPLEFTIDSTATSVCSISSGLVTFNAIGSCVINANQAGNSNFYAAAQVQQSFAVTQYYWIYLPLIQR